MRGNALLPAIVTGLWLSACATLAPDANAAIVTGSDSYLLRQTDSGFEAQMDQTFTNRTAETAYVINCHGGFSLSLERWQGGEWVRAWSPVVLLCLSEPIVIEPGGTFSHTVHVFAGHAGSNVHPQFEVTEIEGMYRLVWHALVHDYVDGSGSPLPLRERVSNTFRIELE